MPASSRPATIETDEAIVLGGVRLQYLLRRTSRAGGLRITIDPRRGLIVSVPPSSRRGWARPDDRIRSFLHERERWVVRHVNRLEAERAAARARGGPEDGGRIHYRGVLHRIRVVDESAGRRRSTVERVGDDGDELLVHRRAGERRSVAAILEAWLKVRAREAVDAAIDRHAAALGASPASVTLRDPRTRWGSASKTGRVMLSWRLVMAPRGVLETVVVHELAHLRVFGHGPKFWALVASRRPDHLSERAWLRRHSHALHTALDVEPELGAA
jgi:predicted metal-dependent hydrolase